MTIEEEPQKKQLTKEKNFRSESGTKYSFEQHEIEFKKEDEVFFKVKYKVFSEPMKFVYIENLEALPNYKKLAQFEKQKVGVDFVVWLDLFLKVIKIEDENGNFPAVLSTEFPWEVLNQGVKVDEDMISKIYAENGWKSFDFDTQVKYLYKKPNGADLDRVTKIDGLATEETIFKFFLEDFGDVDI